jgi:flagellar protein FlaJ
MIVYLSVGIYLYTAYALNVSFIASFTSFQTVGSVLSTDAITGNVGDMYTIGVVLGFFSGLMAGQLASNSVLSGFKHAILLTIATLLTFVFVIPVLQQGLLGKIVVAAAGAGT